MARRKNKRGKDSDLDRFRELRLARAAMAIPAVWKIDFENGFLKCGSVTVVKRSDGQYACKIEDLDRYGFDWYTRDPRSAVEKRLKELRDQIYRLRVVAETAENALAGGNDWAGIAKRDASEDDRVAAEIDKVVRLSRKEAKLAEKEDSHDVAIDRYESEIETHKATITGLRARVTDLEKETRNIRKLKRRAEDRVESGEAQLWKLRAKLRTAQGPKPKKSKRETVPL